MGSKNRYFIIGFAYSEGFGDVSIMTTDGSYFNRKILVNDLAKDKVKLLAITSINEVSESDFNSYNLK